MAAVPLQTPIATHIFTIILLSGCSCSTVILPLLSQKINQKMRPTPCTTRISLALILDRKPAEGTYLLFL